MVETADSSEYTTATLERRRRIAEQLLTDPKQTVTNWAQGLNELAKGYFGGHLWRKADDEDKEDQKAGASAIAALLGGGDAPSAAPSMGGYQPNTVPPQAPISPQIPAGDQQSFIQSVMPYAQEASQKTGLDPRIVVAQSALETGWGKHAPGNNYFGIKGESQTLPTTEVVNGQPVKTQGSFKSFGSPEDSFSGYADFINKNPRYAPLKQAQGLDAQIAALGKSGYATDPAYADKVGSIARSLQDGPPPVQIADAQAGGDSKSKIVRMLNDPHPSVRKVGQALALKQYEQQIKGADPTDDIKEYNLYVQQERANGKEPDSFRDYVTGVKRAGAMTIDQRAPSSFEQGYGTKMSERAIGTIEAGDKASGELQELQLARDLSTKIKTGKLTPSIATIGAYLQSVGLKPESLGIDPSLPATVESLTALGNKQLLGKLGPGGFPSQNFSDTDRKFMEKIVTSAYDRPETTEFKIAAAERIAQLQVEKADKWAEARENGISYEKFESQWRKELKGRNIFRDIAEKLNSIPVEENTGNSQPDRAAVEEELRRRGKIK